MTAEEHKAEPDRRELVTRGIFRTLGAVGLGMPAAVVAVYYLAGWRAAVLAFPVLWVVIASRMGSGLGRRRDKRTIVARIAVLAALFVIPIAAVVWSKPEIMRAWAYATAGPLAFALAFDKGPTNRLAARELNLSRRAVTVVHAAIWAAIAGLFIAGSELLWLQTSIGVWIWYHAFAFPIFVLVTMLVYEATKLVLGPEPKVVYIDTDPPRPREGDTSELASGVLHRSPVGSSLRYGRVSLSQALAISDAIDRAGEFRLIADESVGGVETASPHLAILFSDGASLKLGPDSESTVSVHCHYLGAPAKGRLLGESRGFDRHGVSSDLIPTIIERAWADDWDGVKALLSGGATAE